MAQIKDLKRMCASFVDKWAKSHPVKTYAMDFFKKFPNAPKDKDGKPRTCIKNIYDNLDIDCSETDCVDCWNQEMKENV